MATHIRPVFALTGCRPRHRQPGWRSKSGLSSPSTSSSTRFSGAPSPHTPRSRPPAIRTDPIAPPSNSASLPPTQVCVFMPCRPCSCGKKWSRTLAPAPARLHIPPHGVSKHHTPMRALKRAVKILCRPVGQLSPPPRRAPHALPSPPSPTAIR